MDGLFGSIVPTHIDGSTTVIDASVGVEDLTDYRTRGIIGIEEMDPIADPEIITLEMDTFE